MTDFSQTYAQVQPAIVCITADTGAGLAESSGFVVSANQRNYIMTAAHSVLLDNSFWGMDAVLLTDDGSQGCGNYRSSSLDLPAGISAISFRFIAQSATTAAGVYLDNVRIKGSSTTFKDGFGGRGQQFGVEWSQGAGAAWSLAKYKGKNFSTAARSNELEQLSTLMLNVATAEEATLHFDYKLDCEAGTFIVGYCTGNNCDNRVSRNITAYYNGSIHPLRVVGLDGKGDIALCYPTDGSNLDSLTALPLVADSRSVPIATPVAVVGNPLGIDPQSVATGVIRDNKYSLPIPQNVEAVFTCLSGYAGNSGSPYVLNNGQVVGMLTFGLGVDSTLNGGPSARILQRVLQELAPRLNVEQVAPVEFQKAYLGLNLYGVDLSVVQQLSLPMTGAAPLISPGGFVVLGLEEDSPLQAALQPLDVILTLRETGNAASAVRLGTFPGQSAPSEVTWFMPANGRVDLDVLRFDQERGTWTPVRVTAVLLQPWPVAKDVPLGATMSHKDDNQKAVVKLTQRVDGQPRERYYRLNPYI